MKKLGNGKGGRKNDWSKSCLKLFKIEKKNSKIFFEKYFEYFEKYFYCFENIFAL